MFYHYTEKNMQNNINNNKHDAFSEIFRQKLENHTAPVAPESWDAIQAALKAKQPKRVVPLWWWFSGGAVAAAFLLLFTLQIFNQQTFEQGIAKRHIIHRTIMLQQKQLLAEDGVRAQALKVKNSKVSGSAEYINSTPGVTAESTLSEINETIQPAKIKQNNNEAVAVITEVDAIEEKTKNESASPSIEKTEIKQDDANTPALPEWEDPLKSKRNKNWGLIASVGSAGGASASSPKNVFSDMSGKMSIVRAATVNTSILTPSDFSDKTFFSPLSVGAKVSKHFGETFSLETGFSYTYLLTKFKSDNYNAALHLHYLGLPVQMAVKIWGNSKWRVYGSAGGMVEKGLRSIYIQEQHFGNQIITTTASTKIDGFQWSLNATIGGAYRLSDGIDVYFEPKCSYFFDNDQPLSIRTDRKLSGGIEGGLRFNF